MTTMPETYYDFVRQTIDLMETHREDIEAALEYTEGSHTFDDVFAMTISGRLKLWTYGTSFVLTEFNQSPRVTNLHVFLAGGNSADLKAIHPEVIAFARENGIRGVTLSGRAGWLKVLKPLGWRETHRSLVLDLDAPEVTKIFGAKPDIARPCQLDIFDDAYMHSGSIQ